MFKFSAALNQNLRIWSVSLTTILRSTLAHIQNLALLHRKQNNHVYDHTLAGAACSDGMSISTNRYRKITKQMRLCRVKIPDSTGRTGIICSSRPAKKPLLASNSSPHHQRNVAEEFEDALKNENLDAISTHLIVMVANLSQLYLVFIGRSQFGTIDTEFGAPWNNGDFPLPTDDEATKELRNLDLGGNNISIDSS